MQEIILFVGLFFSLMIGADKPVGKNVCGVNLVSAVYQDDPVNVRSVLNIQANWVAICPWAFMVPGDTKIYYNTADNYFGDRPENIRLMAQQAKKEGLKILLKPHVWVNGIGWPGELNMNETGWYFWEVNYTEFILEMARIAEESNVDMFCIGVEFKSASESRPEFWINLIKQVRKIYKGELTYAANWDNYQNIVFWEKLDYIGIDAFFPLSSEKLPEKTKLIKKWEKYAKEMEQFSSRNKMKVLFTEYGYRSIDRTAWRQWEQENYSVDIKVNLNAQLNAYEALYESVWNREWFAGGFIWKWYTDKLLPGGPENSGYTPQNKPVEKIIREWYGK
ncbi:MAG: hypothetical protein K9G76_09205 [Bacteroidales bacterium]|nr:hypothetical protein [Bacteroidales bacterium]MCF8403728.1 hypothetical protein [Bacteroidales bacterium]